MIPTKTEYISNKPSAVYTQSILIKILQSYSYNCSLTWIRISKVKVRTSGNNGHGRKDPQNGDDGS
jgi:hypothetical protein